MPTMKETRTDSLKRTRSPKNHKSTRSPKRRPSKSTRSPKKHDLYPFFNRLRRTGQGHFYNFAEYVDVSPNKFSSVLNDSSKTNVELDNKLYVLANYIQEYQERNARLEKMLFKRWQRCHH